MGSWRAGQGGGQDPTWENSSDFSTQSTRSPFIAGTWLSKEEPGSVKAPLWAGEDPGWLPSRSSGTGNYANGLLTADFKGITRRAFKMTFHS